MRIVCACMNRNFSWSGSRAQEFIVRHSNIVLSFVLSSHMFSQWDYSISITYNICLRSGTTFILVRSIFILRQDCNFKQDSNLRQDSILWQNSCMRLSLTLKSGLYLFLRQSCNLIQGSNLGQDCNILEWTLIKDITLIWYNIFIWGFETSNRTSWFPCK